MLRPVYRTLFLLNLQTLFVKPADTLCRPVYRHFHLMLNLQTLGAGLFVGILTLLNLHMVCVGLFVGVVT